MGKERLKHHEVQNILVGMKEITDGKGTREFDPYGEEARVLNWGIVSGAYNVLYLADDLKQMQFKIGDELVILNGRDKGRSYDHLDIIESPYSEEVYGESETLKDKAGQSFSYMVDFITKDITLGIKKGTGVDAAAVTIKKEHIEFFKTLVADLEGLYEGDE